MATPTIPMLYQQRPVLNTPRDLEVAINDYFQKATATVTHINKRVKTVSSDEKGNTHTEESSPVGGIPTPLGLLRHLGLTEIEWVALINSSREIERICVIALQYIEEYLGQLALQGGCDSAFAKEFLKKEFPKWRDLTHNGKDPKESRGGNIFNCSGPVKIEVQIVKGQHDADDDRNTAMAHNQELEELGYSVNDLRLGMFDDPTLAPRGDKQEVKKQEA